MAWYTLNNIDAIDTPALVLYPDRIRQNIAHAIAETGDAARLRPHVKTNKIAEVNRMMLDAGISRFKCATIAEAEMLAQIDAPDVLLAYQPSGPKALRLLSLTEYYPDTVFSCLVDNKASALQLSDLFSTAGLRLPVYIDLNSGMNRTGIAIEKALELAREMAGLPGILLTGLHLYDGHIRDSSLDLRQQMSDEGFAKAKALAAKIEELTGRSMRIVAGGSPSFKTHAHREGVECSPGTFVFWDWGYSQQFPEEPYQFAALTITRVVSIVEHNIITTDLGHKSVASESPQPRVFFLNAPNAEPVGHSEEYLCLRVPDVNAYHVGDVLYGVPVHICPTVALYERALVAENNQATTEWQVAARNRKITI